MAWRDELTPASFRGQAFVVETSQVSGGRKTVKHEYPLKDEAFVEDLGRRGRVFTVEAFVIGDPGGSSYIAKRKALEAALEEEGPGPLEHPFHGTRLVAVSEYQIQETKDEGGMARFVITFLETAAAAFSPSAGRSPLARTTTSAAGASTAAGNSFLRSYNLKLPLAGGPTVLPGGVSKPLPSFTFTSITGLVHNAGAALRDALGPAIRSSDGLASLKRDIDNLVLDASSLVRDPAGLVSRFGTLFTSLRSWPSTPRLGIAAMLAAYSFIAATKRPVATTATRTREQINYDATDNLIRRSIIVEAAYFCGVCADISARANRFDPTGTTISTAPSPDAVAATDEGFDSYEDAVDARDLVLRAIDEQLGIPNDLPTLMGDPDVDVGVDDALFAAFQELRATVADSVPGEGHQLPRLIDHVPVVTVPVLVDAYRLYGSIALADDVVARNRIRHPGFVPGGRTLQVLSRG